MTVPGSVLKLLRAQEHVASLHADISAFFQGDPYRLVVESNADFTEHLAYPRLIAASPFNQWALRVGEAVHNMRSAIDHAVYELGVRESGQEPPPGAKVLMMPVSDGSKPYSDWRVKTLSEEARAFIESIQPYNHPNGFHNSGLWVLNEIDIADKHRLLQVVSTIPVAADLKISGLVPGTECTTSAHLGMLKDETPVMTLRTAARSPDVKMEGMPVLQVGIKRVEVEDRESFSILMPYLGGLLQESTLIVGLLGRIPAHTGEVLGSSAAEIADNWNPPEAPTA